MSFEDAKRIWGKEWILDMDFINKTINQLNINKDSKILDIGTGWGIMSINLALNGFEVLTGEPEVWNEVLGGHKRQHGHKSIKEPPDWKNVAKELGVKEQIKYRHFDAEALPFLSESFDGVFMYNTLHHIQDKKMALNECLRVLRPNGVACIFEMNQYGNEHLLKKYNFEHEVIDPSELLNGDKNSIEVKEGQYANAYIFKKIPSTFSEGGVKK